MKSKYILVIIVIACGLGYIYYANSNNVDLLEIIANIIDPQTPKTSSILDPNTKIYIISNVRWSLSTASSEKTKDSEGNSYWVSDFNFESGEGNYTLEVKETNIFKLSVIRVDMFYTFYEKIPDNAFLELKIIKRGKIIFNKTVNDRTCITWEP